jgi:YVTN family beta-propeller protein
MFDPGGRLVGSTLSKDEKLFFAAVAKDNKTDGSLVVVDLEKGTIVHHALTGSPTRLLRLGSKQEPWVFSSEEMRSISETGELGERRISLNKPSKPEEGGESIASAFLDSLPGQIISLGEDHVAILIYNMDSGSRHKVALIDLKKLQVDAIIPTMSAGEKARIRTGRIIQREVFGAGGSINPRTGDDWGIWSDPAFIWNWTFLSNEMLTARPDGRFLYALDLDGHKVTVIDVQTATVVRRISVNEYITKIEVSSNGKQLICSGTVSQQYADFMNLNFSGPVRQTINLETNNLEN